MPASTRPDRKAKHPTLKRAWSVSDANKPKKRIVKRSAPARRKTKPTYEKMLVRALVALDAVRKSVSFIAVRKWVESQYPVPDNCTARLRTAANSGVAMGYFVVTPTSVRLTGKGRAHYGRKRTSRRRSKKSASSSGSASPSPAASPASSPAPAPLKKAPSKAQVLQKQKSDADLAKVLGTSAAAGLLSPKPKGRGATSKQFIWQYEDGGRFHDYDGAASDIVEQCYQEYLANPHMMDVRAVKSGDWQYQVDFINMKQTNIQHQNHRVRNIRRIPNPYL